MEAKDADKGRLQEVEAGLGQVQEKDAEIKRLQRELQTLRVCNVYLPVSSSLGLKQPVSLNQSLWNDLQNIPYAGWWKAIQESQVVGDRGQCSATY